MSSFGNTSRYRPVHSLMLWLTYNIFGIKPWLEQLINLSLHFANVTILYLILSKLLSNEIVLKLVETKV